MSLYADQGQNGRVISPGYTDDPAGALSQREDQPSAHLIGDNVQASISFLLIHFIISLLLEFLLITASQQLSLLGMTKHITGLTGDDESDRLRPTF